MAVVAYLCPSFKVQSSRYLQPAKHTPSKGIPQRVAHVTHTPPAASVATSTAAVHIAVGIDMPSKHAPG
jgi:hypothetical protein